MIYKILYWWLGSGYTACSLLLGSYIVHYTGASSLDLAFLFMINPATIFLRPLFCAQADRLQKHRIMLCWCLGVTCVSYITFALIPFLVQDPYYAHLLTRRTQFWIFTVSHLIGSISICGTRALADALAVNYAERTGGDFGAYRKYGSISYGISGYLIGQVNQNWILPDFVPAHLVYISSLAIATLVVAFSPKRYYVIQSKSVQGANFQNNITQTEPSGTCKQIDTYNSKDNQQTHSSSSSSSADDGGEPHYLTIKQQALIFWMLFKSDLRIPVYLLFIFYGGFVGFAPQNYVFTYINQYCNSLEICDAAALSGTTMFAYCLVESSCYILIGKLKKYFSYASLLSLTLVSVAFHYLFYGFIFTHVSPYFFLIECLHGLEYSISLVACVELGYMFANQVGDLIPELVRQGIISEKENYELVKVSLMATMSALFTLTYEGIGTIVGAFLFGVIIDHYSFITAWRLAGTLAIIGLAAVASSLMAKKCCNVNSHKSQSRASVV